MPYKIPETITKAEKLAVHTTLLFLFKKGLLYLFASACAF